MHVQKLIFSLLCSLLFIATFREKSYGYPTDEPFCYMLLTNGQTTDLTHLCQATSPPRVVPPPETRREDSQLTRVLNDALPIYADTYCEARTQGLDRGQSTDRAVAAAEVYVAFHGIDAKHLSQPWMQQAQTSSNRVC
jgi:hypothetical protein